jgi:DNA-binding LacI/PurR family transcriptional regulator
MKRAGVTLDDVARAAGVSRGTASNVFNRPHIVRAQVRERVLATAASLGYGGPDPRGRMLSAGRANAVGVATAEPMSIFFDDPFARMVMSELARASDTRGAGLSLISTVDDRALSWNIQTALVDGFVLYCVQGGTPLIEAARRRKLPFVAFEYGLDEPDVPVIGVDNVAGGELAARHLLELGHRRIAILSLPFGDDTGTGPASARDVAAAGYSTTRDRILGYWRAAEAAGLSRASIPLEQTRNDKPSVCAAMERLFANEPPTALLAMSDQIALYALDWLRHRGMSVPREVSIIGFDGVHEAEQAGLTTVAQPTEQMARLAIETILDGVPMIREAVPATLRIGTTTGKPPLSQQA